MLEMRETNAVEHPGEGRADSPPDLNLAEEGVGTLVLAREDEENTLDRVPWFLSPSADGRRRDPDDEDEEEDDDLDDDVDDEADEDEDADDDLDEEEFDDEDDEDFDDDDWEEEEEEK